MPKLDSISFKKSKPTIVIKPRNLPIKRLPKMGIVAVVAAVFGVVFFALVFVPQAEIEVKPRTEPVTRDLEIRIDSQNDRVNPAELIIPAKIYEQELEAAKTYSSSGSKNVGQKASGFVYIYNFSKNTLILKKETTVLAASGRKYFFTQDASNIRPTARIGLEDEEIDQTSLVPPIPVVAESAGEQYNLSSPNTRLEITNEAFGSQPKLLYAGVAPEGILGGTTKEVKIITEADIAQAYQVLASELVEQAKHELAAQSPGLKILENAVATEIVEQKTEAAPGQEGHEFEVRVKLKYKALAYNQDDVLQVIRERIIRLLPENKQLAEDDDYNLYSGFSYLDLTAGYGLLSAHFEDRVVYKIDKQELLERSRGKTEGQIREIFLSRPEIDEVKVRFSPFWSKKAPRFSKKIRLDVVF